ncbi:hypothetical protein DSLASN_22920 [Desulfoluna limicola]|uniref:Outer membrane protein beta-barrel domain-containing protein n=1 Tax=Desulfoluna limicola TaxID=2810562 RepID=A0ABM7PGG3_9BACT|nr:hypothetical protein [Desulfoluna limicola]BCS96660.1 hypothetical protein DSLASN_22920 [Desulfoluna limicola]
MKLKYCISRVFIVLFMVLVGLVAVSNASQGSGDNTLQLSGSFTHSQGADSGVLNLDVAYGRLLTDSLEIGILQYLGYSFIDNADDTWVASTIPYINYHFSGSSGSDKFLPFVGAFIGASYNDEDTTGTIGPQLGFKSFVKDSTFILVRYRYEWFFDELTVDDVEDSKSDGNHVVTLGVGFIF